MSKLFDSEPMEVPEYEEAPGFIGEPSKGPRIEVEKEDR